jgi:hypothetical protein
VHFIFGAFIFGAIMPRTGVEALPHEILERLEQVSVLLLLPVFFVFSGMKVNLSTVDLRGLVELSLILAVAIGGKFIGAYAGARLQGVRSRQAGALAALMYTRGLTETVILTVGLQLGILDGRSFSLMVVMALVTTVMAGPLLALIYPKRRVERDVVEADVATEPDVVVVGAAHPAYDGLRRAGRARLVIRTGPLPASWDAVRVRLDSGPQADAALQVAAQLAAARGASLVVEATGRIARRVNAVVDELNRNGLTVDLAPATPATEPARATAPATALAGSASGTGMGEPSLGALAATLASPVGQTTLIVAPRFTPI